MSKTKVTAKQVRALLDRAGLNQCQAARAIGISPRAMRRYVSLDKQVWREPPTPVLLALAAVAMKTVIEGGK